jgi:hypothetical protein
MSFRSTTTSSYYGTVLRCEDGVTWTHESYPSEPQLDLKDTVERKKIANQVADRADQLRRRDLVRAGGKQDCILPGGSTPRQVRDGRRHNQHHERSRLRHRCDIEDCHVIATGQSASSLNTLPVC